MAVRQRGSLLIMVLLLCVLLVTMGLGFLSSRVGQYQSTLQVALATQARMLARSGIEDARTKLNRDRLFPPSAGDLQYIFSYTEDYVDGQNQRVGAYRVSVDTSKAFDPEYVIALTSTGLVGPAQAPIARHTYRVLVDIDNVTPSPTYFQFVRWDDLGSI